MFTSDHGDLPCRHCVAPADDTLATVGPVNGAVAHELDATGPVVVLVSGVGPLLAAGAVPGEDGGEAAERREAGVGGLRAVSAAELVELLLQRKFMRREVSE